MKKLTSMIAFLSLFNVAGMEFTVESFDAISYTDRQNILNSELKCHDDFLHSVVAEELMTVQGDENNQRYKEQFLWLINECIKNQSTHKNIIAIISPENTSNNVSYVNKVLFKDMYDIIAAETEKDFLCDDFGDDTVDNLVNNNDGNDLENLINRHKGIIDWTTCELVLNLHENMKKVPLDSDDIHQYDPFATAYWGQFRDFVNYMAEMNMVRNLSLDEIWRDMKGLNGLHNAEFLNDAIVNFKGEQGLQEVFITLYSLAYSNIPCDFRSNIADQLIDNAVPGTMGEYCFEGYRNRLMINTSELFYSVIAPIA